MERDTFGICLNKAMLSENMYSTFYTRQGL